MESKDTIQPKLPTQSLTSLSFCANKSGTTSDNVKQWLKKLPVTEHQQNGESLVTALNELASLNTAPHELYQLAEMMRSATLNTANHLHQRNLRRHITFDSSQQPRFDLSDQLHLSLATVYKSVVVRLLDSHEHNELLPAALHRAISDNATTYLLQCLLHRSASSHQWLELHNLYQLAVTYGYLNFQQNDPEIHQQRPISIEDHYKRALLFSRSDTNKLSQSEIQQVWQILSIWIKHCKIKPESGLKTYFSVNLKSDKGLQYAPPEPDRPRENIIGLNVRVLLAQLEKMQGNHTNDNVLTAALIQHLLTSWGQIKKRSAPRQSKPDRCETCFGFIGLHYQLAGKQHFNEIVEAFAPTAGKSQFSKKQEDIWSHVLDAEVKKEKKQNNTAITQEVISFNKAALDEAPKEDGRHQTLATDIINSSHTGYCLKTTTQLPRQHNADDLIGVRSDQNSPWALYTTRWLGFSTENDITFGVNLITRTVEPAAISLIRKIQNSSQFQRAFILPNPGERSIIIPNLSENEGIKFELIHNDMLSKGQLIKCIYKTPTWCQYQFKLFT